MLRDVVALTWDPLTLESCHVMPIGWSILVPSVNWTRSTVPELARLQFYVDRQLKVPIFTFFLGLMRLNFKCHPFNTFAETMYNDVLRVGLCPEMRPVGVAKKRNKDRNFHASNWLFAQTTHFDVAPAVVNEGSCPRIRYMFQVSWKSFHVSRELWRVENRALPLIWPLAYTSLYHRTNRDRAKFWVKFECKRKTSW